VGCAFTICLERKQQRDREKAALAGVGRGSGRLGAATQRTGSFRQTSLAERLTDPQSAIVAGQYCAVLCLEREPRLSGDEGGILLLKLLHAVLCMTVVHNDGCDMHANMSSS